MIPTPLAMALAVMGWSPVTMITLIPALRHLLTASGTAARGGSIMDIRPTKHKFSSGKFGGWRQKNFDENTFLLSISDLQGQGLYFGLLHKPLVLVCGSKILVTWQYFCGSVVCKTLITWCHFFCSQLTKMASRYQFFANHKALKMLSRYFFNRGLKPVNGPWSGSKKSACPQTSETDSMFCVKLLSPS